MKNNFLWTVALFFLILFIVLSSSVFVIKEGEVGFVLQFGKIQRSDNTVEIEPGLHFKIPFIQKVYKLDKRIQTLSTNKAEPFNTTEKKEVYIDYYVQWRIDNTEIYYTKTRADRTNAENLIRKYIDISLREQIGSLTIQELVTGQSHNKAGEEVAETASKREQVMQKALASTLDKAKEIGVEIIDVRMKQINLPPAVSSSIYKRMSTERHAVAQLHRSKGKKQAEEIKAKADKDSKITLSNAQRKAKEIRSEGDAQSTKIYAEAYSQNPELFDFLRSMDAYRASMIEGDNIIVTDSENEFFKYLK
jgi:membrane protease subunit HflC